MSRDTVSTLQQQMRQRALAGDYDQPGVLAKLAAKANEGDLDAASQLRMLREIDLNRSRPDKT